MLEHDYIVITSVADPDNFTPDPKTDPGSGFQNSGSGSYFNLTLKSSDLLSFLFLSKLIQVYYLKMILYKNRILPYYTFLT